MLDIRTCLNFAFSYVIISRIIQNFIIEWYVCTKKNSFTPRSLRSDFNILDFSGLPLIYSRSARTILKAPLYGEKWDASIFRFTSQIFIGFPSLDLFIKNTKKQ